MAIANYLSPAGRILPKGARLMLRDDRDRALRFMYEFALIAEARGHRMFPSARAQLHRNRIMGESCGETHRFQKMLDAGVGPSIGILFDPADPYAPSSSETIASLCAQFANVGLHPVLIDPSSREAPRVDGLFIRTHTHPHNLAFGWSADAGDAGLPCLDDRASIMRGCSKLYQMEAFACAGIAAPQSMALVAYADLRRAGDQIGFPLVVKASDSSFSRSVHRARNANELRNICELLWTVHPILLAQKFTPSDFDWRVGVLNGEPLYACKYFMADGHWKIVKQDGERALIEGRGGVIPLRNVPPDVVNLAVRAAACIGQGLYGVDIKCVDGDTCVIEVNDNPTIECDLEAAVDPVWPRLAAYFRDAIELSRHNPHIGRETRYA